MKRRFWQVHLTTVVVLLVCVTGSALINCQSTRQAQPRFFSENLGWPMAYYTDSIPHNSGPVDVTPRAPRLRTTVVSYQLLLFNVAILLLGSMAIAAAWQWMTSRLVRANDSLVIFRMQLLTAILLMICASGLLAANVVERSSHHHAISDLRVRGWPFEYQTFNHQTSFVFSKPNIVWNI